MTNNIKNMLCMIEKILSGEWSFDDFKNTFYDFYLNDVTDQELDNLPEPESDFFSEVHEKLDWVDKNPDEESRQMGWIDIEQFLLWLSNRSANFGNTKTCQQRKN